MRVSPPESDDLPSAEDKLGSLPKKIVFTMKPAVWVSILIFSLFVFLGFALGNTFVIRSFDSSFMKSSPLTSDETVIALFEVSDLGNDKPDILSIWYVYVFKGENPRLGFTPVASISMVEQPNTDLLQKFELDKNGHPSPEFLSLLQRTKVKPDGYIVLDQAAVSVFINWFAGKEFSEPTGLNTYSMSEYGQVLRGLCASFPLIAEREYSEFPWSLIAPMHFQTSLGFSQVMENMSFLTETIPPQCEMVTLP